LFRTAFRQLLALHLWVTEMVVTGRVEEVREDGVGVEVEDREVLEIPLEVALEVVVDLEFVLVLKWLAGVD
jgi:hypothetical protein